MTLLLPLLIAATAQAQVGPAPPPAADPTARYERCVDLATGTPEQGLSEAGAWRIAGGGFLARQCEGLAYAALARWAPAAAAFEAAARDAEVAKDARAGNYWAQAANAYLAGGEPARARAAVDAALAKPSLIGPARGLAHLDRARAIVAAGDVAAARPDLDQALALVPADPLAWLLSAAQARRAGELPRAQKDIAEALRLSSDDAQVRLEAGNIAAARGDEAEAKLQWKAATNVQPGSPAAASAQAALAQFDAS